MGAADGRDKMLGRLVAHVRAHGLEPDASLRRFADELGTSHRMLAYYFGSRDGLLAAVLAAMRAEERESLHATAQAWDLHDAVLAMWSYYTDPEQLREHRVFFYVFSLALQDPELFSEFLASLDTWVDVTTELAIAEGFAPVEASRTAQLIVSAVRGLLMDRLASAVPDRVDAAFQLLVDRLVPVPSRTL